MSGKCILIIDDNEDLASNLRELLEGEGYLVRVAKNGKAALEYLQSDDVLPSLIVLDLEMPIMDGFQFRRLQELQRKIAYIPIVVMTTDHNIESTKMKIGAKAFIKKPVDIDQFLETVEGHCNKDGRYAV